MKSNKCILTGTRSDIENALREVEKVAQYNQLTEKQCLQLRLLAEEMMGMQAGILGFTQGVLYLENKGKIFNLYLHADVDLDLPVQEKLVEMSTSKTNAAYSGFMGKIRRIADHMLHDSLSGCYFGSNYSGNPMNFVHPMIDYDKVWALSQYREQARKDMEQWDELEKSIVASIADELVVGARTDYVDLIAVKDFGKK